VLDTLAASSIFLAKWRFDPSIDTLRQHPEGHRREAMAVMALAPAKLERAITRALAATLQGKGFARADAGGVERWQRGVYMFIGAVVTRIGGVNRVEPFAQLGFEEAQKIYAEYMDDDPVAAIKRAVNLQVSYCYFSGGKWGDHLRCQEEAELPAVLGEISRLASEKFLPFLEQNAEPKKVLELYLPYDENDVHSCDPPGWHGHSSALGALILARLYGPEHYAALKKRYAPIFRPLIPEIKERAMRLVSFLDGERSPESH